MANTGNTQNRQPPITADTTIVDLILGEIAKVSTLFDQLALLEGY